MVRWLLRVVIALDVLDKTLEIMDKQRAKTRCKTVKRNFNPVLVPIIRASNLRNCLASILFQKYHPGMCLKASV